MATTIRTITDPRGLLQAQLNEIRAGNAATRKEINRLRDLLEGGLQEQMRLEVELAKMTTEKGNTNG